MNIINFVFYVSFFLFVDATVSGRTVSNNTLRPIPDSVLCQKPLVRQMFRLLREKSADWSEIGLEFGISLNFRKSAKREQSTSDSDRLEAVLNEWVTTTDQRKVTWREFIEVMHCLKYADIIAKTKEFLQSC